MTGRAGRGLAAEVLYRALAVLFYAAPRLLYEIHVVGAARRTFPPGTLIVTNHKRDLDSVILPATLYRGQRPTRRPLHFAAREDMFLRGFLARYDVVPTWLRRWVLYRMELAGVLAALRVHPVRRFPERTMEEALREALALWGDRRLDELLVEGAYPPGAGALRISEALAWERRSWWQGTASLAAFHPPLREALAARQRAVVAQQIEELAGVLQAGGVLYFAPEGVISPDGSFQPFRAGLKLLLERVPRAAVAPVCIVYDFMRPGRLRVFIRLGALLRGAEPPLDAEAVRRSVAILHTMTASQLYSAVVFDHLEQGETVIERRTLVRSAGELAATLAAAGLPVDPLVLAQPERAAEGWVAYVTRRRACATQNGVLRFDRSIAAIPASLWANPIRYGANELRSILAALAADGPPASG
ncbi:MAG TPA: hypothetical protein VNN19_00095 [bacterium]|nr:hypothetical protein [bacterium]